MAGNPNKITNRMVVAHSVHPFMFLTGSWLYNQIVNLEAFQSIVLTTLTLNRDIFPFDRVYTTENLPKWRQIAEKAYRKLFKTYLPYWVKSCRENNAQILHSHFGNQGWQNLGLAKKLGIPHVVSFYGSDLTRALFNNSNIKMEYGRMFHEVSAVFAEGPYSRKTLIGMGCPREKIYISHLGVDLQAIKSVKREWKIGEPFCILIVGTFTQKKGIIIALQAIEKFCRKNPKILVKVNLVGDARNRTQEQNVKKEILDFINNTFLKNITKMFGYLPYSHVLSMAYDNHLLMQTSVHAEDGDCEGGFPVIITDMLATGMPVLGSNHCDIPEIICDRENGRIAEEGNVQKTYEALQEIMLKYQEYSRQWYNYNQDFLKKEFDAYSCAMEREKVYISLRKKL